MSIFTGDSLVPIPKFIYALRIWEANRYIDFKEASGGPERTAEIDPGIYLPEALADAVKAALDAADGASGVYTVAFNRTTEKFTISTSLAYMKLLWFSGTNAASGAASALGYAASADSATGASCTGGVIPNRFIATQPIRGPKYEFKAIKKEQISDGGCQTVNIRRVDRTLKFEMIYIEEQNVKGVWKTMIVDNAGVRGGEVDYYPISTGANYIRGFINDDAFKPDEMLPDLPGFYKFGIEFREKLPKSGTISLEDLFSRTVT